MKDMSSDQEVLCHSVIHTASAAAAGVGAGLAQIPGSDSAVLIPIQLAMTIGLGRVFGFELSESAARASLATMAATTVGRTISQVLVGWIPIAGNLINAGTAASMTEAIGWMLAKDFARQAAYV